MQRRLVHGLLLATTALLSLPPVAAQGAPEESGLIETARSRVYRLRVRVEPTWLAEPGECLGLTVSDLKVSLRGERIDDPALLRLDRELEPTIHALLIDTSRSMVGKLDRAREAATGYVERLQPVHERAMVVSFDESVLLQQVVTDDPRRLAESIAGVRMSRDTSMYDALAYTLRELFVYRDRPVVLLLTDGVDSTSLYEREDIFDLVARRGDLTIFTIGLALPPITRSGPSGQVTAKKFLQRLSGRTGGKFFDAPTPSRLERVYREIREQLDNEAMLSVVDVDSEAEPGRVRVGAVGYGCKVRVLRDFSGDGAIPDEAVASGPSFPIRPDPILLDPLKELRVESTDEACSMGGPWRLEAEGRLLRGCVYDVTMDYGALYDPFPFGWVGGNAWLRLRSRPVRIPIAPVTQLPEQPDRILDALADQAVVVAGREIGIDPRRRPPSEHGRPYHDYPGLVHERTFFDLRPALAQALYAHDDYREWTLGRLREEAAGELEYLEQRLRRLAPERSDEEIDAVLAQSEEARTILARASQPSVIDVERHLAAWLGDVPAHDLFVRWEARQILRLLEGGAPGDDFVAAWRELRKVFFLPSYTRALTVLAPGYDPGTRRIGLWRVTLPRLGWLRERVRGYDDHPEFANLPLDLIPELPLGYWVVRNMLENDPEVAARLRSSSFAGASVSYDLLGKPKKHDPLRAFQRSRITIALGVGPGRPPETLRIVAEVSLRKQGTSRVPRVERLETHADADQEALGLR
jgi:hypothetical protein